MLQKQTLMFFAIKQILSGVLVASHLSIAILCRVQHQIAVELACGSKNDAGGGLKEGENCSNFKSLNWQLHLRSAYSVSKDIAMIYLTEFNLY